MHDLCQLESTSMSVFGVSQQKKLLQLGDQCYLFNQSVVLTLGLICVKFCGGKNKIIRLHERTPDINNFVLKLARYFAHVEATNKLQTAS